MFVHILKLSNNNIFKIDIANPLAALRNSYSPDVDPSNYYLFKNLKLGFQIKTFTNVSILLFSHQFKDKILECKFTDLHRGRNRKTVNKDMDLKKKQ